MSLNSKIQKIVQELREALKSLYGDRLSQLVLFGSQARGEAGPYSDIDILVVFKSPVNLETEKEHVIDITSVLSLENDTVISCLYMPEERFLYEDSPLLRNIRNEGVIL